MKSVASCVSVIFFRWSITGQRVVKGEGSFGWRDSSVSLTTREKSGADFYLNENVTTLPFGGHFFLVLRAFGDDN